MIERPPIRAPAYAWAWFQRFRPAVTEAAKRLTGGPPPSGFVDDLRLRFEQDDFTRDVVIGVVADVAFGGRVPSRRAPGASWDRGLTWWAATIAGATVSEFEARSVSSRGAQRALFEVPAPQEPARTPPRSAGGRQRGRASQERSALAGALRELLNHADGDMVPAAAVRQLLAQLEGRNGPRRELMS